VHRRDRGRTGNIFFSDLTTNRVYRVNNGILTVFAGSSTQGYAGDGGPAASAALYNPRGVVFDGSGNLYISDAGNYRIRKVNTAGIISTVAGNGLSGFSAMEAGDRSFVRGDGADYARQGIQYIHFGSG